MSQKILYMLFTLLLLTSCSLNPPDWLHGQWQQKSDSLKADQIISTWTIHSHSIYHKTNKSVESEIKSSETSTVTEIKEPTRYIIRTELASEKHPYFEVFKLLPDNTVVYYDSSALISMHEHLLVKIKP